MVGGDLDVADLAAMSQMTRRFGNKALAAFRAHWDDVLTWPGGSHLDGPTSDDALARWRLSRGGRDLNRQPAEEATAEASGASWI